MVSLGVVVSWAVDNDWAMFCGTTCAVRHLWLDDHVLALLAQMEVFTPPELAARQHTMYEQYINAITIEADCLQQMLETGVLPACATDLNNMTPAGLAGDRPVVYKGVESAAEALRTAREAFPDGADVAVQARFCAETLVPAMGWAREHSDSAENLCQKSLWPFPAYADMLYAHHSDA